MKPWLIQSATFRVNSQKKGVDKYLNFEYMGSSEFEFGALGKSLARIRSRACDYKPVELFLNKVRLVVLCNSEQLPVINDVPENIALDLYSLKERCSLKDLIAPGDFFRCYHDFWWDIENDWMVWKYDRNFNKQISQAITTA